MPRCGATLDENSVPPWTRGDFRGVLERWNTHTPALRDRVKSSQDFTFAPPLPWRRFSGESLERTWLQWVKELHSDT